MKITWYWPIAFLWSCVLCGCNEPSTSQQNGTDMKSPLAVDAHLDGERMHPAVDAAVPQQDMFCESSTSAPLTPSPWPRAPSPNAGINAHETHLWPDTVETILGDPNSHFIATYLQATNEYIIVSGPEDDRRTLIVVRQMDQAGIARITVRAGEVSDVFPSTSNQHFGTYEALLSALENPTGLQLLDKGYTANDPRVGFLPPRLQAYPQALVRLVTLFDAADAPDFVYGVNPWSTPSTGSHGGLDLLQSRASLILSGPGIRAGVVSDEAAALVDISPTILAALGAPTTSGLGPDASYEDGLYLRWQDGRVLSEAFEDGACQRPKHVVLLLFDGLQAMELNQQMMMPASMTDAPNLHGIANRGVMYRYGAVSGFPSYSAPGHMTVGTGLWPGHHGVLSNSFFGRSEQGLITPFDLLDNLPYFIQHPDEANALYDRLVRRDVENLAQAAHRALGVYDPETATGAYVAVINELTFKEADFSTLQFFGADMSKGLFEYRAADSLAMTQFEVMITDETHPVPTILQMSMLATDAAGESDGPHSNLLRDTLAHIDERVGQIVTAYQMRGALEDTLFILTSDHGMALQDANRLSQLRRSLRNSPLQFSFLSGGLAYYKSLRIDVLPTMNDTLRIRVENADNGVSMAGVSVRCVQSGVESQTDADGLTTCPFEASQTGEEVTATLAGFNDAQISYERP